MNDLPPNVTVYSLATGPTGLMRQPTGYSLWISFIISRSLPAARVPQGGRKSWEKNTKKEQARH